MISLRMLVSVLGTGLAIAPLPAQLPGVRPEAAGMSSSRIARMSDVMRELVAKDDVSGAVTAIARRGRLVEFDTIGFADREGKRPMRSTTIFRVASMTKAVTAVAVMMLVEEGRVRLRDPVSRYIPAFAHVRVAMPSRDARGHVTTMLVPSDREITIHDLMTHRAGLSYGYADTSIVGRTYRELGVTDGFLAASGTIAENVDRLARAPLAFQPGTRWQYSLAGDVLGRVVEVASGMPLDRFLADSIFGPLQMNDTFFWVPDDRAAQIAVPYTFEGGRLRPMADTARFLDGRLLLGGKSSRGSRTYFSGGGGLYSTAGDYLRFLQMLLNGGELEGQRILSPKSVELMTANATADLGPNVVASGTGFGLGVAVVTDLGAHAQLGSVGQYAWGGAYGTTFFVDPKEQMVGVLMIQLAPDPTRIDRLFETLAYQAVVLPILPPAPPPPLPSAQSTH